MNRVQRIGREHIRIELLCFVTRRKSHRIASNRIESSTSCESNRIESNRIGSIPQHACSVCSAHYYYISPTTGRAPPGCSWTTPRAQGFPSWRRVRPLLRSMARLERVVFLVPSRVTPGTKKGIFVRGEE
uniref:Uncharacterized protein n=1 Tax=Pseudo-nitzschia australis TaxID=44445 RepID=A0A7S4EL55_9STRA